MTIAIDITPDGTARCLWTESLPLADIGRLDVARASNVEFNHASQLWEVRLASNPGRVAFSDPSRAACIAWEIDTINAQLLTA